MLDDFLLKSATIFNEIECLYDLECLGEAVEIEARTLLSKEHVDDVSKVERRTALRQGLDTLESASSIIESGIKTKINSFSEAEYELFKAAISKKVDEYDDEYERQSELSCSTKEAEKKRDTIMSQMRKKLRIYYNFLNYKPVFNRTRKGK